MKKENDSLYDEKVQKILDKLISEEAIAYDFYVGCVVAACPCKSKEFSEMFFEIAIDERDDHMKKLIDWAIANDYSVPFKYKDIEKHAGKKSVKQLNELKEGLEAKEYVIEAIKSEQFAIESYEEALKEKNIPYDLHCILLQNLYDEREHLEELTTKSYAFDANADLVSY